MPIRLITGTPGAGKTLLALEELLKELGIKSAGLSVEEIRQAVLTQTKRPVCVIGVEGLVPDIFNSLESPLDWESLEDGTIVLVDEAWKWFGSHNPLAKNDDRVLRLAEHRHRGFDFILTCQQPSQLLAFLRGLVGEHIHVTRKFGTTAAVVYSWPHLVDDPNGMGYKDRATERAWVQPKAIYDLYQSATLHTIKRRIPWKLWAGLAVAAAIVLALTFGIRSVSALMSPSVAGASASAGALATGKPGSRSRSGVPMTAEEWRQQHEPVVPGVPWSAPIFQDAAVTTTPDLLCVSSVDERGNIASCRCYTEQVTPVAIATNLCLTFARNGVYNPYRAAAKPSPPSEPDSAQPSPSSLRGSTAKPFDVGDKRQGDMWTLPPNGAG